jgi:ethanolamine utilization protein EutQ (cupin superfamily)
MAINENNKEIDTWSKAVQEQTTKVEEMAKSAVGATDIFRNLGAGFIGGVGGAIVSQMVSQVAGVVMQAGALAMPTLDVMLGSGQTGIRRQQELAQVYGGSNFSQSTLNQEYVQRGFTSGEIERFSETTSVGAQAIARANQLNERLELLRAESAAMAQQANSPAGAAAPYGASAGALLAANFPLLGQVDIGGSDSVAKMIGTIINQSMDRLTREERMARYQQPDLVEARQAYEGYLAEPKLASGAEQMIRDQYQWVLSQDQIDQVLEGPIADAFDTLPKAVDDFLNTRLREAESQFRIEPGENEDLYKALEDAGNQFESDLLPSLRNNKLNITRQDGQPFNLQQDLPQLAIDLTQLDPETFAGNLAGSKSFQNALEVFRQQRQRQYIGQRATIGFQSLGNQIIDPGAGGRNLGIAGGVSQGFTREYEDLANQAQAFEDQGVEMMKALMPSQSGLIDEYTQLGDRLKELNEQSGRIKADQAMRSYALSVKQARFAVEDLQALTGKGEGSEIGRLERVNMLMQRRLQILQFEQQQRAINFQVAVAGFQAEGMTGAERAARLQHARREAAVQQEMLNLNRGMFGNQVQIVDQRNIRSLEVATDNLNNIIATFDENNKLAQIGARATLIQRNMQNLQSEWQHNLQTIMAIDEQRTEFMRTVGDETETLITEMDKTVTDPFDKAVGQFKTSQGTLAETVVAMQSNVISPFQEGIDTLATHVVALQDMFDGKQNSTLMVRDVTINQKITGTVVDYKELVDMIVEELGKQGIRTGQNTGGR